MQDKRVLLVGDYQHRDFREAVAWLVDHTELMLAATVDAGLDCLRGEELPEAIIIAQSRPGQFQAAQIEQLHAGSPLSRLVALLGSWCEGEMRTGRPWPGVIRLMWHQWRPRMIPQLSHYTSVQPGLWTLPRTASVAERMAHATEVAWPRRGGLIAVHARTARDYEAISTPCVDAGYATYWVLPDRPTHAAGATAAIVDGIAAAGPTLDRLKHIADRTAPRPVIAVLDYVRRQDYDSAVAAGVAAVVAKPLLMYDVLWYLEELSGTPDSDRRGHQSPRTGQSVTPAA
jgi:hypothetical protein